MAREFSAVGDATAGTPRMPASNTFRLLLAFVNSLIDSMGARTALHRPMIQG